jgi:hypothetical protein
MAVFTTIAAGIGLAATATTTGMSFAQARKQRRFQRDAEDKAAQMMSEAREKLEVNYYDQLAIQKEPYELEREALISAGAQAIAAGTESERGAAATAGRVQMAQQLGQRDIAAAMGQEMLGLEKLSAQEESRLRDVGVQLDLAEVEGAQMAAAQAAEAGNIATQQGVQGIVNMGQQVAAMAPLYARNKPAEISAMGGASMTNEQSKAFGNVPEYTGSPFGPAGQGGFTNLDFEVIGQMNKQQYNRFLRALKPEQRQMLFMNPMFQQQYSKTSQFMNPFFY